MFTWIMGTRLGKALSVTLVTLGLILGVFLKGKSAQREEDRVEVLEDYIETKERIEDVEVSPTRAAAIERLRRNGLIR